MIFRILLRNFAVLVLITSVVFTGLRVFGKNSIIPDCAVEPAQSAASQMQQQKSVSRKIQNYFSLISTYSMRTRSWRKIAPLIAFFGIIPNPTLDASLTTTAGKRAVVVAGGCFWGMQAVFDHLDGVTRVVAGYSGGSADTAKYEIVSTGTTGHAESVKISYDPSKISLGTILKVFFSVAHNPTELNRQGPDSGTQYRSAIFFSDKDQARIARAYIAQLDKAKVFARPIVTEVSALKGFYPAEEYHQNFAARHPNDPYIVINDAPKVARLRKLFPDLYKNK